MDPTANLQLTHQRVDDVPLLLGLLIKLRFPLLLDQHLIPHPHHQGLSQGWLITLWIAYILSHADHRKSAVRDWANGLRHTLETVTGHSLRDVDCTDDRLTLVLQALSDNQLWDRIETDLGGATCEVYEVPLERIRLDSTTSCGFHTITPDGLMQRGHSKDHRPDLPQLKLMAAAAEPSGQIIASDVHPGNLADDPLYLPLIDRVRALLGRTGLLYTGDCKMAALETRATPQARGDFYLTRLPLTGATKDQAATWVEDALSGTRRTDLVEIRIGEDRVGVGYEFTRPQSAPVDGGEQEWLERIQVIRSDSSAETQAQAFQRRLEKAEAAVRALTPPPGPGRIPFTAGWELERAVAAVLAEHEVTGLLEVSFTREETRRTRSVGRGRGGPNRPQKAESVLRSQSTTIRRNGAAIERRLARQGWWIQVTNVPKERLSLEGSVAAYRGGWSLGRDFHRRKDRPLGIGPLCVRRDDQIIGLTHLLTLALRVLTLFELLVRQGQKRDEAKLPGLYPGQARRTTERPTGSRVLSAIALAEVTLTRVEVGEEVCWHLTPLPLLLRRVLAYLGLPETVYTGLVINSS